MCKNLKSYGSNVVRLCFLRSNARRMGIVALPCSTCWISRRCVRILEPGAMKMFYRDRGNTVMTGRSLIPYLQGCAVGGTTIINSAIIWRLPGQVLFEWEKLYGIGRRKRPVVEVKARKGVILAASAVQTPLILRASGLKGRVGDNFQAHPGAAPVGIFDEPVEMWRGATQGYECTHFHENPGFKFEVVSLPAELGMVRLPGVGRELMNNLREYRHAVVVGVQFSVIFRCTI